MKNIIKITITLFCLVSIYLYGKTKLQFTINEYNSKNYIQGIDISYYQGNINWEKINTSKLNLLLLNRLKVKQYKIRNLNVIGLKAVKEIL